MNKKYLILLCISIFSIALDQLTKLYIYSHFQLHESLPVITRFFNITYVRNPGAAFGFLAQTHPEFREVFFLAMPPIALGIIVMILRSIEDSDLLQIVALSSIFGGAIGNYIDRIRFGAVIDFLDLYYQSSDSVMRFYTWPTFNLADSFIVMGVCLLVVLMFFRKEEEKIANNRTVVSRP